MKSNRKNRVSKNMSYKEYRTSFPSLVETKQSTTSGLDFAKLISTNNDMLPEIKKDIVKPGWVRICRDENNKILYEYGQEVKNSMFMEEIYQIISNYEKNEDIRRLDSNINDSKRMDENKFVPLDRINYENSFNNDDYMYEEVFVEESETSESDCDEDYDF